MGKQIEKWQIQRVHVLKSNAGLGDVEYRGMLSGYGVDSSKDLTYAEANELIRTLVQMAPVKRVTLKYDDVGFRQGYASPKQLRMLEAMWAEVSVFKEPKRRDEAYLVFLRNRFNRISPLHIEEQMVQRIKKCLESMQDNGRMKACRADMKRLTEADVEETAKI